MFSKEVPQVPTSTSLITTPKIVVRVPSEPYQRCNFRKAITNQLAKDLPSSNTSYVDNAYQDFCNSIITAAKRAIPHSRRNKYKPYWGAECEDLYQAFLGVPRGETSDTIATALLALLDEKRNGRWSEAVESIDFTHYSRLAWTTINNLTGRSRNPHRPCP